MWNVKGTLPLFLSIFGTTFAVMGHFDRSGEFLLESLSEKSRARLDVGRHHRFVYCNGHFLHIKILQLGDFLYAFNGFGFCGA